MATKTASEGGRYKIEQKHEQKQESTARISGEAQQQG
jgi:hypothetical protein